MNPKDYFFSIGQEGDTSSNICYTFDINSIQKTAKTAGWLYLTLIPLGILGLMYIPTLIISGDITTTISNIIAHESLFRLSIVSSLLIQLVFIFLVLYLYKLLKSVNGTIAKLMVILVLVAVPIVMINEVNHGAVLFLLNSADQSPALVSLFLNLHEYGVNIAQIFWGLWLFPLGYLIYKSKFLPNILGILLMIGCFGYVADSFIFFIDPNFGIMFSEFLFIGEVALPLWLVIKGVNNNK